MNICYILFSKKLNRYYVGVTHINLNERLIKHNTQAYGSHRFTAKADDWCVSLSIECSSFRQAMNIETHIKRMKSKTYIENLTRYPEMTQKLLEKFKV